MCFKCLTECEQSAGVKGQADTAADCSALGAGEAKQLECPFPTPSLLVSGGKLGLPGLPPGLFTLCDWGIAFSL